MGLTLSGLFIGSDTRGDKSYMLVACGIDSYRVKLGDNVIVPADVGFGDCVTAGVRVSAFNGNVYYTADYVNAVVKEV